MTGLPRRQTPILSEDDERRRAAEWEELRYQTEREESLFTSNAERMAFLRGVRFGLRVFINGERPWRRKDMRNRLEIEHGTETQTKD
jgi:hypothetical protein